MGNFFEDTWEKATDTASDVADTLNKATPKEVREPVSRAIPEELKPYLRKSYVGLAGEQLLEDIVKGARKLFSGGDGGGDSESPEAGVDAPEGPDYEKVWELLMRQKDLFKNELYPSSVEAGMDTASKFYDFITKYSDISDIKNIEKAGKFNEFLKSQSLDTTLFNQALAEVGNTWGMGQAEKYDTWQALEANRLNSIIKEMYEKGLEDIMPNAKSTFDVYRKTVEKLMGGQLPEDVINQTKTTMAELGLEQGRFGEALSAGTAASLGASSLQLQQTGLGMLPGVYNLAQSLKAPQIFPSMTQPQIATNVTSLYRPIAPTPSWVAPYDPAALQNQYLSGILGTTIVSPASYLSSAVNTWQTQTEMAYADKWSLMNYQMQQDYMDYQKQSAMWGGIGGLAGTIGGGVLGAIAGGPLGALVGAGIGGSLGGGIGKGLGGAFG